MSKRDLKIAVQITMFRVFNYGSALQAYALSEAINSISGWHCKTIDYSVQRGNESGRRLLLRLKSLLQTLISWIVYGRRNRKYEEFLTRELDLTKSYRSFKELQVCPPSADVYITGSDQTFNPFCSRADPAFFLKFAPEGMRKISYAASFAVSELPENMIPIYKDGLSDYSAISTREESGVSIARHQLSCEASWCCDPTLLLTRKQWELVAAKGQRKVRGPYILVYCLAYMTNPYPEVDRIIFEAQQATGYRVVYLNGRKQDIGRKNSQIVKGASPYEFVDLFLNASFIITSSYHGVVFSLHSGKPFIACVNEDCKKDSRLYALLKYVGAEKNAINVPIKEDVHFENLNKWSVDASVGVSQFRNQSLSWLMMALNG